MKSLTICKTMPKMLSRFMFSAKKKSPEIALVAGIVGLVGAAVLACRGTIKAQEVAEDTARRLDDIKNAFEDENRDYNERDKKIGTKITYCQMAIGYAKCYGPAIAVGTISIISILYSHHILSSRNAALATAYTALDTAYKKYRKRVAEKIGEEAENDIYHGVETIKAEITEMTEDGKTSKKKINKKVVKDTDYSPFARFFDEANPNWEPNSSYNLNFLRMVEDQMTNRLRSQGHLFLNEVYDALGMERSDIGQNFGWVYDQNSDESDNFVDFGIYDGSRPRRDFVNGYENVIIIDPNVDGDIMSRVFGGKKK